MTKIESRPIEGRNWEYRFFIDFEGNLEDSGVRNALRGLRDETRKLKILGNYARSQNVL
jgi:chorismate mutase/prephenate dehydratase